MKRSTSSQSKANIMFISISTGTAKNGGLGTCPLGAGAS